MTMKTFSGEKLAQRLDEFAIMADFLRSQGVRRILEIGTRHGDALHWFGDIVGPGGTVVGVDLPGGPWGHPESQANADRAVEDMIARGIEASMVYGDSRDPEIIAQARARGPFDFVFIDGDHSLKGVQTDWKNFGPLAPLVGFHDIDAGVKPRHKAMKYGVPALFAAIRDKYPTISIVSPERGMGIGLVRRLPSAE